MSILQETNTHTYQIMIYMMWKHVLGENVINLIKLATPKSDVILPTTRNLIQLLSSDCWSLGTVQGDILAIDIEP